MIAAHPPTGGGRMSDQTGENVGTEAEGQTADVTTPRTDEKTEETTTESVETSAPAGEQAAESGLDNEPLQAGAEPELGSEVE
jgi:hypothetical protein